MHNKISYHSTSYFNSCIPFIISCLGGTTTLERESGVYMCLRISLVNGLLIMLDSHTIYSFLDFYSSTFLSSPEMSYLQSVLEQSLAR